jgi:pimeloyl-ACP methyl ester carboxylesterase
MSTRSDISYADADGVRLATASAGTGTPVVFIHELAGDLRNWQPQVQAFSRRHRCLTYNARGYPPSDVPSDPLPNARWTIQKSSEPTNFPPWVPPV